MPIGIVDQPAGTGFSFTSTDKYDHSLQEVSAFSVASELQVLVLHAPPQASDHLVEFLRNFYQVFPELLRMDVSVTKGSFLL
jgi:carboxypeptidase D